MSPIFPFISMLLGILGNKGLKAKTKTKEMQVGEITEYGQVTKQ